MVSKGNYTTEAHGGTMFNDRQTIRRRCWHHTAARAGAAAQSSLAPRASRAEPYAWMLGLRAKQAPGSDLIWAAPGEIGCISKKKRRSCGKAAILTGVRKGKKPLFCVQRSWLGRHLSEKQQEKDGGVCRVIGTISRGRRHCNSSTAPLNSRIQPHFLTRI